ncbi:MAG TPA: hypothetical protein VM925_08235, partial [Labilithrix sp.]|nr:hypothetical protein [Labilithrix sp.]
AEIMVSTPTVREYILDQEKTPLLRQVVAEGVTQYCMQTFDQSIMGLLRDGLITEEEALKNCTNPNELSLKLKGISSTSDRTWQPVDAAADKGAEDMTAEEQQHEEETEAEKQRTMDEAAKADQQAASDQRAEKTAAQRFVARKRGDWRDEQTAAVEKSQTDAQKEETEAGEEVETEREKADTEAKEHIESGERDAKKEKGKKEAEAEAERAKAKKESSGFFGWLASKAKALFNKIKAAIKSIMKALRDVVKGLIDAAKKLAVAAIEAARKVAVAAIRAAGDAIIAIGDVALAAFPEAREKFRGYINEKVADAEDAVNELADDLKKGVEALLDALGEFLDKALQLLEKAMLAVVDAYAKVVDTIIKAAEAIAKAFGIFFTLIKDIASGPGAWISNLGASVVDGIKNHLVKAMKDAISGWFKSKVEEVIGLPIDLMKALFSGGINLDAIAKIVWSALKTAIPSILVQLLIEKLVAMIVPAAGAVMAIIEGLQAAWGTISRIIAAIDKFVTFLKAVKGGGAGPSFAQAVAAGAVAVIDFVANWLLLRLMKPAKKVSGKLAAMAKRILAKLKKGLKKVGKKVKGAFKKAAAKVKGVFKRKKGGKKKPGKKKEKKKETAAEKRARLDRAVAEAKQFTSGKKRLGLILKAQLLRIRFKHKLTSLVAKATSPGKYSIRATVNPTTVFTATAIGDAAAAFAKKLALLTVTGIQQLRVKYKALAPKGFTPDDQRAVEGKESYLITLTGEGKTETVGKFEKFTNDNQLADKPGPKTERDEEHNTKIRNVIASYRRRGYRLISGGAAAGAVGGLLESPITIPDTGETRRADAVLEHPKTKDKVYVNVGKGFLKNRGEFKKGDPIKREREAAEDIKKVAAAEGARFKFYAYNV